MNGIRPASKFKEYLGDGAYVDFDGYSIILTTEDGISTTNSVVLEPGPLKIFEDWVERLRLEVGQTEPRTCVTCEGSGLFSKATRDEPEIKCDDCNGRGTE